MAKLTPTTDAEIADIIASSIAEETPLEIIAGGTKRSFGESIKTNHILDLSKLSGIVSYQPEELVLTVKPATLLSELTQALADSKQVLAFEPPDLGGLWVEDYKPCSTIGGAVLCNLSGSRRPFLGAARDYFLGFTGVSGRGEFFKAGGKVVKNVTGFDLCKLIAGSYGTLVAVNEITLKTHPRAELCQSWSLAVPNMAEARAIMRASINAAFSPTGAAYIPDRVILRFEGGAAPLAAAKQQLQALGDFKLMAEGAESDKLWQGIGSAEMFHYKGEPDFLWRISLPPEASVDFVATIDSADSFIADWGGGLIWLNSMTDRSESLRGTAEKLGGYAHLMRCPPECGTPRFHPRSSAETKILKSLKAGYDPHNILNPNRMGF